MTAASAAPVIAGSTVRRVEQSAALGRRLRPTVTGASLHALIAGDIPAGDGMPASYDVGLESHARTTRASAVADVLGESASLTQHRAGPAPRQGSSPPPALPGCGSSAGTATAALPPHYPLSDPRLRHAHGPVVVVRRHPDSPIWSPRMPPCPGLG